MAEPATELPLDSAAVLAAEEHEVAIVGRSPWYLAWRRLRRNYVALVALAFFVVIVTACALAPVYARHVAHTGPNDTHVSGTVQVSGKPKQIIGGGAVYDPKTGTFKIEPVTILGPTWWHARGRFVLGADNLGRDVAVRLLYGGFNSLRIGIGSALICTFLASVLALLAGYFGGWIDWIITRFFDLIWAFPVFLLAIALGSALSINGFHHFGINIESGSLWIPTLVISYVLIPYVASTILVFFTLIVASNILTEAGLSFLGAGVRLPDPSWGNLIASGQDRIQTAPWEALAPGLAIVFTVLSLNIFGDGLRDALDPRAKVRIER